MDLKSLSTEIQKVSDRYAEIFTINRDADWYVLKLQEEVGELIQTYLMLSKRARGKGESEEDIKKKFGEELADVLGQVLLLARYHGIDMEKAMDDKWLHWNKK